MHIGRIIDIATTQVIRLLDLFKTIEGGRGRKRFIRVPKPNQQQQPHNAAYHLFIECFHDVLPLWGHPAMPQNTLAK